MRFALVLAILCTLTAAAVALCAPHAAAAATSGWSAPTTMLPDYPDKYGPYFVQAASGDAVLAFLDTTSNTLVAYNFTPAGGWSSRANITNGSQEVLSFVLGIDPDGRATLAYAGWDGVETGIWSVRFLPGIGWSGPTALPVGLGNASLFLASAGPNGDVFLGWEDFNDTIAVALFAERFDARAGWDPTVHELAEQNTSGQPILISLAAGPSGQAAATFSHLGVFNAAFFELYEPGAGWGPAIPFSTSNRSAFVGVNYAGDTALFSWVQSNGTHTSGYLQTYNASSGWSAPARTESFAANVSSAYVLGNADGNRTAVFLVRSTPTNRDLWVSHYTPAGGWEAPLSLETGPTNASFAASTAAGNGDFFVSWLVGSGQANTLFAVRYLALNGWQSATEIAPQQAYLNYSYVTADARGNAVVAWIETGSPYAFRYATFVKDNEGPSLTLSSPPALVATTQVTFVGTSEPGAQVWVDGVAATVDGGGNFTATLSFSEGNHTAQVVAKDFEGNLNVVTVPLTVDIHAELAVGDPVEGAVVATSVIPVRGTTEQGAQVLINGVAVAPDASGIFAGQVVLTPGDNTVLVEATDRAGNRAQASIRVTYLDPIAPLTQQIANVTALLEALLASGNSSQAQLDQARADLSAARAQLSATNATLAANQASLQAANENLTSALTRLDEAQRQRDEATGRANAVGGSGGGALDLVLAIAALAGVGLGFFGMMQGRKAAGRRDDEAPQREAPKPKS
jgi:hypothetical protein